jgi:hypothetical protein
MSNSLTGLIPYGLDHRIVNKRPIHSLPTFLDYNHITTQALELLKAFSILKNESSIDIEVHKSEPVIGILISCFWPEQHLKNFLNNLLKLENSKRLVPIFINAGMETSSIEAISVVIESNHFVECGFIEKPGCTIYEAWNVGIKSFVDKVDYFTNFNVDDLRHPLCLEVQAASLDTFPEKLVSVTDYLYFFEPSSNLDILYQNYSNYSTLTPVINLRTLTYRNLPHCSPMWRSSIHQNFGLYFDELSCSAADSQFWFLFSDMCYDGFFVISLPLSLYYYNPVGLSTSPQSKGHVESKIYLQNHYSKLKSRITTNVRKELSKSVQNIEQYNLYSLRQAFEALSAHV